ncbi:transglutaminase family protein [Luteolibacter pohnpeiensis]|uniref:Transglutaminase family protein n=1 Tax=Luteolibacter pohnpeiensis TaxID=454153 RepID=A0A934S804_9BACT|nr:transglutaminase family protein [Luteolibacter pohnpeiensis]MBK1881049.1 transglutaminase family protein [Luteolibacter pohnpeiensis]
MKYELIHRTRYLYEGSVTVSHHLARLAPRHLPGQRCPWHELEIHPVPVGRGVHADAFGNITTYFEIEGSHEELEVIARSLVEVSKMDHPAPADTPPWEAVRDACHAQKLTPCAEAGAFRFASPMVPLGKDFSHYALPDFPAGRPVLEAVNALMGRIHREFKFDTVATDVATPVADVLRNKAGVCQDFAHLMLACLRSLGLSARYVSGYLETAPPPGQKRLTGADASHAWVSVYCGEKAGWIDADPTNNVLPGERHITVAWGRDFSDVSPLRGVTLGAGGQTLRVAVDVIPVGD